MKQGNSFWKKVLFLPAWLLFLLTIGSAALLLWIFFHGLDSQPYAYAVYVFSFYTLTVDCIACSKAFPRIFRNMKGKAYENPYTNRYLTDVAYKTHISLWSSLSINVLYIATNAISAVLYQTVWFAIFAIYYGIMAILRFLLVRYVGKNQIGESRLGELKRARVCSYLLMTINLVLSGVVLMMIYYHRGFEYQGYLIYVMAAYTFYTTTIAIVNLVKYRKYHSPVMSVTKMIQLASSLFSMLFLETAMFAQFGQETSEETERIMIMATGAGICAVVVGMSMYMIVGTSKEIREKKIETEKGDNYAKGRR